MTGVGDVVLGRYRLDALIAESGMAVVYRAYDQKLACPVALKGLTTARLAEPEYRARLLSEARAAAALRRHPHVVTVNDIHDDEETGGLWISMDLIEGPSLRERIRDEGPLPLGDVARVVEEIGSALSAAHAAGIVHRDVKPENVLFDGQGAAYLCDFGIVTSFGEELREDPDAWPTETDHRPGTPPYMAPELILAGSASPSSDQFALAVTTFEALAGRLPWGEPGVSAIRVFAAILQDEVPPVSALRDDVPKDVDPVLTRATAKEPSDRYADVAAFVGASVRALARPARAAASGGPHEPAPAGESLPTPSRRDPIAPAPRRPGWLVAGGVTAAAVVAVLAVLLGSRGSTPEPPLPPPAIAGDVACPVFEAWEGEETAPWLGAAAADETCRRLAILFGGPLDEVDRPSVLLGLHAPPPGGVLVDPFDAPHTRERSLEQARAYRPNTVDGSVRWSETQGFALTVVARHGDRVLGSASGRGRALHFAVGDALRSLERQGVVVRAGGLDEDVRDFAYGAGDIDYALFGRDLEMSVLSGVDAPRLCAEVRERGDQPTSFIDDIGPACRTWLARADRDDRPYGEPRLPTRSGPRLAWNAVLRRGPCRDAPKGCVERLDEQRAAAATPYRAARYAYAASQLEREWDRDRATTQAATAVRSDPGLCFAHETLAGLSRDRTGKSQALWRWLAECPSMPSAWASPSLDFGDETRWALRRAYRLAPENGFIGLSLARSCLRGASDDPRLAHEARAIGDRYVAGPPWLTLAGEHVLALWRLREGRFAEARSLLWKRLQALDRFGYEVFGDIEALTLLLRLELEVFEAGADERIVPFVRGILAAPEDRLRHSQNYYALPLLSACLRVDGDTLGDCLAAIDALPPPPRAAPAFEACRAGARVRAGVDPGGAERAANLLWSAVVAPESEPHRRCDVPARLFDEAGQPDRAATLDARLAEGTTFHGIDPALVSMADRAFDAGDCDTAVPLAERVIEAWRPTVLDARLPVVDRLSRRVDACR